MKVILNQDVPNLGQTGEVREAKPGFARNFLIPKNLAYFLDDPRARELIKKQLIIKKEITEQKEKVASYIQTLSGKKIVFRVKVNKKGKPFKAIKRNEIAKKLDVAEGLVLTKPIEEIGINQVLIKKGDLETKISVEVLAEK